MCTISGYSKIVPKGHSALLNRQVNQVLEKWSDLPRITVGEHTFIRMSDHNAIYHSYSAGHGERGSDKGLEPYWVP